MSIFSSRTKAEEFESNNIGENILDTEGISEELNKNFNEFKRLSNSESLLRTNYVISDLEIITEIDVDNTVDLFEFSLNKIKENILENS